jgi:hypothetical protein
VNFAISDWLSFGGEYLVDGLTAFVICTLLIDQPMR